MYKVIKKFADLEDKNYIYNVGDVYPREGAEPSDERIEFLASSQNKLKTPVIELVLEKKKKKKESEEQPVEEAGEEESSK